MLKTSIHYGHMVAHQCCSNACTLGNTYCSYKGWPSFLHLLMDRSPETLQGRTRMGRPATTAWRWGPAVQSAGPHGLMLDQWAAQKLKQSPAKAHA